MFSTRPSGTRARFSQAALGDPGAAAGLRGLAANVSAAMNRRLWAGDHYVTELGRDLATVRDFVDYDANLIAVAHGVPTDAQARAFLARLDRGRCRTARLARRRVFGLRSLTTVSLGGI